ncbi:MAG TPA: xanthine dehydrogenase family protein subunit M [Acidobacteriota bacterium]|nr:xanthine dehydrogenase family protein subunit M [Acidobacteriota bacterium]
MKARISTTQFGKETDVIPGPFDYHAPDSLEEALSLLGEHGDDAKILAGGQSLIPAMRFRLALPAVLIDINRLSDLEYVRQDNGSLAIGAMTRETHIEHSEQVKTAYPMLADAAEVIADPLVRNRATVGGNLAHADPANDHPAVMLAYQAELVAAGPGGERVIPIDEFFTGFFENALSSDEILTQIRIPKPGADWGGAYLKIERKVGDYAVAAVAVQLQINDGACASVRIGLTNVNPQPMRATEAEQALAGRELSDQVLEEAGKAAAAQCEPSPDLRGSVEYKRDLVRILTKRAIRKALQRAKGASS